MNSPDPVNESQAPTSAESASDDRSDGRAVPDLTTVRDVIETREQYLEATAALASGTGPIAIDAERASGYRYSQRAYLIQIFRRGAGTFLFDPPAIADFSELNSVLKDEEWILHAASQDLACLREVGLDPTRIFDTELGARLAGLPRVGLGTVVESLLGIHLAKEHSAADWSTRPLPQTWLVYAALDVDLLVDVRDAIAGILAESGKLDLAMEEFESVLKRETKPGHRGEGWHRLSGLHSIHGAANLAVARELWEARDRFAAETDIAPGRLIPDSSLVTAAKAMPQSKNELAALKDFNGRVSRSELSRWWEAIETGRASEDLPVLRGHSDSLPPARTWSDRNPDADKRLKAARQAIGELSQSRNIPIENLLTPESLRRLAWRPPEPLTAESIASTLGDLGARTWQIHATVQIIHEAFVDAGQTIEDRTESKS